MKVSVLVDNNTTIDKYFTGEPGASYFIETEGKKILFDTGYSDVFLRNAIKMNINLLETDYIVFSHGHLDHTGGLEPLLKYYIEHKIHDDFKDFPEIVAHPQVFNQRYYKKDGTPIGIAVEEKVLKEMFSVNKREDSLWLTDKLVYLGEIPRRSSFEAYKSLGVIQKGEEKVDDYILDDTALAYTSEAGLVIITGCSHAGITNIIEQAKEVTGQGKVIDIIGGLHLLDPARKQMEGTKEYLKKLDLKELHACHCTDLNSKMELAKVANLKEVGSGMQFSY